MLQNLTLPRKISALLTFVIAILWIYLYSTGTTDAPLNAWFTLIYSIIPLFGGLSGLYIYKKWSAPNSADMRLAVFFLSLGLLTWGIGQVLWGYYSVFLSVELPYPSLADAGYILSPPFWLMGLYYFSKSSDIKLLTSSSKAKYILILVPFIISIAAYYLLFVVGYGNELDTESGNVKLFFDLAYPIFDTILLIAFIVIYSLVMLDVMNTFSYKTSLILLVLGVVFMFLGDAGLSYTSTIETSYNGDWVDLMFVLAMFFLSQGVLILEPKSK